MTIVQLRLNTEFGLSIGVYEKPRGDPRFFDSAESCRVSRLDAANQNKNVAHKALREYTAHIYGEKTSFTF